MYSWHRGNKAAEYDLFTDNTCPMLDFKKERISKTGEFFPIFGMSLPSMKGEVLIWGRHNCM